MLEVDEDAYVVGRTTIGDLFGLLNQWVCEELISESGTQIFDVVSDLAQAIYDPAHACG